MLHNNPDQGRTDEFGNREYLIEVTGGPKKYYNRHRRRNPNFQEPNSVQSARITEQWYKEVVAGLRQERMYQHLSQRTLAGDLKTNQSVICRFERGKTNPSLLFLQNYALALGKKIKIVLTA